MRRRIFWLIIFNPFWPMMVWAGQAVNSGGTPSCCLDSTATIARDSTATAQPAAVRAIHKVIGNVIEALLALAGPIAVLVVLYAAFLLITSAANEIRVKKAWHVVIYVVVGLVILALAKDLVGLVRGILRQ